MATLDDQCVAGQPIINSRLIFSAQRRSLSNFIKHTDVRFGAIADMAG